MQFLEPVLEHNSIWIRSVYDQMLWNQMEFIQGLLITTAVVNNLLTPTIEYLLSARQALSNSILKTA